MIEQATVLIVSDFPEITDNLRRYLLESEFRFRVLLKSSSASLLLCNQQQIDLILLDYSLPNCNGLDYLARLRASYGDNCPSVIILGDNDVAVAVKAIKNGAEDYLVKQQLTKEGLIEAVRSAVIRIDIEQNQTLQAVCVNELAELNLVEQALRESEEKLSFILNNVNVSISRFCVFANHDWRYDYYSSGCETVFGYTSTELVADKNLWQSRVFPEDLENVIMPKFGDILAELTIDYEYRFYHKDGSLRWIKAALTSQRDEIQHVWYVTSVDSDITKQKEVEAALHERRQEKEILLEIAETARIEAEVANHTKDEFLAIVSHELRSPLNSILGWAKLMQTRKLDEAAKLRALQTIERNAKAQAQLIEDLLDISRMIRGNLRLNLVPVTLINIIEAAIDVVTPLAQAKQINLVSKFDTAVGYVSGDSNRLQQIFINLLTNALKFTPTRGKVEVSLSVNNLSQAEFTVTDTGKGISPEFLPHVFERFRRADSTTTRSKDGLGLGLAIVYNLVELHGGKVTAASPGVGMGATFTVTLPILTQEAPQLPQTLESPEVSLSGIDLLVVDDDKDCCEFLEFTLRNSGGKVKTATSVVEAFITLQDFQPDIIISDISMPEQDGYIFLQNLRSLEAKETKIKIPAIALTANVSEEDKHKAIKAGFQFHLSKPVEPETLLNTIANILTTETQSSQSKFST